MQRTHVRTVHAALPLATLALLVACGDDNPMETQNQDPVATVSADPTEVPQGDGNQTVVTLDASGSSDPDSDPLTFSWSVQSGTYVNGTSSTSEVAQVTFPGNAPYAVTLTVSDGNGGQDTAQTTIALS